MTLATKPAKKLDRIKTQILEANSEVKELEEGIKLVDGKLTKELGKVNYNKEQVATMEAEKQELDKARLRLASRIEALQKTLPDTEEAVAKAALKDAIARHPVTVQAVNNQLKAWLDKAKVIGELASLAEQLVEARNDLALVESELKYLTAKLEVEGPELPSAKSLTSEDTKPIIDNFHKALTTTRDPWAKNKYDGLLQELNKEKREQKEFVGSSQSTDW